MIDLVLPALVLVLVVASLVDIITRPESDIQHLPKVVWVLLVVFLPVIGGVLWFVIGRTYSPRGGNGGGRYAEPFHRGDPGVLRAQVTSTRVRTTEQELADLDREIALYEKQARLKKLRDHDDPSGSPR